MERPHGLSSEQKKKWNELEGRDILSTKFFDVSTLRVLGFEPTVCQLLEKGGLNEFVTKNAPTYPSLVREFLCTLRAKQRCVNYWRKDDDVLPTEPMDF